MEISTIYDLNHKRDFIGLSEYHTPRRYEKIDKNVKKPYSLQKISKRKSYITQVEKLAKQIPAPNAYNINPEQQSKKDKPYRKKIDFEAQMKKGTYTFIDDIIKKAKKIPGVGIYETNQDHTQQIRNKYKLKNDKARKQAPLFRSIVLDNGYGIETLDSGPGKYQSYKPLQIGKSSPKFSIPKLTRETKSLTKLPSAFTYTPIPSSYQTFSRLEKLNDQEHSQAKKFTTFGTKRSLPSLARSPGPKYSLIVEWAPQKKKSFISKNLFQAISNSPKKSIYYN